MPETQTQPLLDPKFLARLEQLELVSRKIFMGRMKGERRSKKKGQSVEFADYRNYVVGDDLRHLDWNLYARLDKLFLRLFMEEEDLHVYLLIDNSLSMDFGSPTKLHYAKQSPRRWASSAWSTWTASSSKRSTTIWCRACRRPAGGAACGG